MELTGKVAVVTGASSGIGRAGAVGLAEAGMRVVAVARRKDLLDTLAAEHPEIRPYPADVTRDDDVAALAGWVAEQLRACHVLVNSAGTLVGRRFDGPDDVESVHRTMDVNFFGTVRCTAAFAQLLETSAPSRVINVASVGGKLALIPAGYAASKFATVGFTEALQGRWARRGIAVCQLNPGLVVTEGFPQRRLVASRVGRLLVVEPSTVARALVDVARRGTPERTVPRWYRTGVFLRHVCPPLYRLASMRGRR